MRTVIIESVVYETFDKLRDWLFREIPYAIISMNYLKNQNRIVMQFWDSDYIPEDLQKYIVRPSKDWKTVSTGTLVEYENRQPAITKK